MAEQILKKSTLEDALLVSVIKAKIQGQGAETTTRQADFLYYKDYYMGRQTINRGYGRSFSVTNVCQPIVDTYTNFLSGSFFDIEVKKKKKIKKPVDKKQAPQDPNNPEQEPEDDDVSMDHDKQTEMVEELLYQWMDQEEMRRKFPLMCHTQSLLGESGFYLMPWDPDKMRPTLMVSNPYYIYRAFKNGEFSALDWGAFVYDMPWEDAQVIWGSDVKPVEKAPDGSEMGGIEANKVQYSQARVIHYVQDIIKDKDGKVVREGFEVVIVGDMLRNKRTLATNTEFNFFTVPNRVAVNEPSGISDLRNVLSLQDEYNIANSNMNDIVSYNAAPIKKVWGKIEIKRLSNDPNLAVYLGRNKRDGGDIETVQNLTNLFPVIQHIEHIENRIARVSGLPKDAFMQYQSAVTYNAQFQPTLNIIETKRRAWENAFTKLFRAVLYFYARFGGPNYSFINAEDYSFRIVWPNSLRKDDAQYVSTQINLFKNGLQSLYRTMENIGIQSPTDEMMRIAFERNNPLLNPQIQQPEAAAGADAAPQGPDDIDKKMMGGEKPGSQEQKIRQENEELAQNQPVIAQPSDDHELHLAMHEMVHTPAAEEHKRQHRQFLENAIPSTDTPDVNAVPDYTSGTSMPEMVPGGQPADTQQSTSNAG